MVDKDEKIETTLKPIKIKLIQKPKATEEPKGVKRPKSEKTPASCMIKKAKLNVVHSTHQVRVWSPKLTYPLTILYLT